GVPGGVRQHPRADPAAPAAAQFGAPGHRRPARQPAVAGAVRAGTGDHGDDRDAQRFAGVLPQVLRGAAGADPALPDLVLDRPGGGRRADPGADALRGQARGHDVADGPGGPGLVRHVLRPARAGRDHAGPQYPGRRAAGAEVAAGVLDVRRLRRLHRVEDRAPRHRDDLRRGHVLAEARWGAGLGGDRLGAGGDGLRGQPGPVRRLAAGHHPAADGDPGRGGAAGRAGDARLSAGRRDAGAAAGRARGQAGRGRMTAPCGFEADGRRCVLRRPLAMPHASTFLWNRRMLLQPGCRGYATAQFMQPEPAKYAHAPVLEARTFMQPEQPTYAHHPGRFCYVKDEDAGLLFSAPHAPVNRRPDAFAFSVGVADVEWTVRCDGIEVAMSVALPPDDVAELWTIRVRNRSGRARRLSLYPYFPVGYMSWMNQAGRYRADLGGIVCTSVTPYQKVEDWFRQRDFPGRT